jgi:outer membrane protein assembly factor BamD
MRFKKLLIFILIPISIYLLTGCGGSIDTATLTPEEHYEYAKSLYDDEDYEEAINQFQSIVLQYPGSTVNDDAQYYLGMTYFNRGEYLLSAYEYSRLIKNIPASSYVPMAQFMLAESYYQLSPSYKLDQVYSKKALEEFQVFIDFFPTDPKAEEAERKIYEMNMKLAEKEFQSAYIYEKMEYYNAAIMYYDYVKDTYHDTEFAEMALYNKIMILLLKERETEALRNIALYINKYPDTRKAEELDEIRSELEGEML